MVIRQTIAIVMFVAVMTYIGCVLGGVIEEDRQLDAAEVAIIGVTGIAVIALAWPETIKRLRLFELMGFKIQFEELKEEIDGLSLVLLMVLPEKERGHLINLANGETSSYEARSSMRNELRKLRQLRLIKMKPGRTIGGESGMGDRSVKYDLADFVELTDRGRFCVSKLKEQEVPSEQSNVG